MTHATTLRTSWPSKSLPWLIPTVLVSAPRDSTIVVLTPWIEDVVVSVPKCDGDRPLCGSVKLSLLLEWLGRAHNKKFVLYVRDDQLRPTLNYRLRPIAGSAHPYVSLRGIALLHAKLLVTDSVVVETSANLLTNSLYRNLELVSVYSNPENSAVRHVGRFFAAHSLTLPGR